MEKISKHRQLIISAERREYYEFEVLYNQDNAFYIVIPNVFKDVCDHLSPEDRRPYNIGYVVGKRGSDLTKYIVSAPSENSCIEQFKTSVSYLMSLATKERRVIIVFFLKNGKSTFNSHQFNEEHEQTGLSFGLTYAIEKSIGDSKTYCIERQKSSMSWDKSEKVTYREQIRLYDQAATIIEDTPENRASLDQIYVSLSNLISSLVTITKSNEDLTKFLASIRLLPV